MPTSALLRHVIISAAGAGPLVLTGVLAKVAPLRLRRVGIWLLSWGALGGVVAILLRQLCRTASDCQSMPEAAAAGVGAGFTVAAAILTCTWWYSRDPAFRRAARWGRAAPPVHRPMMVLYQHLRTGVVRVRESTINPRIGSVEIAERTQIAASDLSMRLVPEVLAALEAFGTRPFDLATAQAIPLDAKARRVHSEVIVFLHDGRILEVMPLRRTRGGAVGHAEDEVHIEISAGTDAILAVLLDALHKAGTHEFHVASSRRRNG